MPAISGEPFRGVAGGNILNPTSQSFFSIDFESSSTFADRATWEGNPGDGLTMTFRYFRSGGDTNQAANTATVRMRIPGTTTDIGSAWTFNPAVASGSTFTATRAFHFDDNPISTVLEALRSGMMELYVTMGSTGGVQPWSVDSRGTATGLLAGHSLDHARGYARSRVIVSNDPAPSNVSIGGAVPSVFSYPDPVHTRITFSAVKYRSVALELELLRTGTATVERESTLAAQTAVDHDFSWTATSGANSRIGSSNSMFVGSQAKDLRVKLSALDFGGDNEYAFAASGHAAGWVVDSDLQMTNADELTADPRLTVTHLMQMNSDVFTTPPTTGDTANRLTSDLAFLSARFTNARAEGQNGITATLKNWDTGGLTGTESSPVNTTSQDSGTQGGEAGWLDTAAGKLPLVWDEALPGGSWTVKAVITAPADAVGLESGATRTLTLLSPDPRILVIAGAGVTTSAADGDHWHPGEPLLVGLACVQLINGANVVLLPDASPAPNMFIGRFNVALGRAEYLDSDLVWKATNGVANLYAWPLAASAGDSNVFIKTFTASETADWGEPTLHVIGTVHIGGTPYSGSGLLDAISSVAFGHLGRTIYGLVTL